MLLDDILLTSNFSISLLYRMCCQAIIKAFFSQIPRHKMTLVHHLPAFSFKTFKAALNSLVK